MLLQATLLGEGCLQGKACGLMAAESHGDVALKVSARQWSKGYVMHGTSVNMLVKAWLFLRANRVSC